MGRPETPSGKGRGPAFTYEVGTGPPISNFARLFRFGAGRSSASHDVACPGAALDEAQDEQDAHGEILERIGQASHHRVDGGLGAGRDRVEAREHDREAHQYDEDDDSCDADAREVPQEADPELPRVIERQQAQGDRREARVDVELDAAGPAHDERDDVGHDHDEPADHRDEHHGDEGRDVVLFGDEAHGIEVELAARPEERDDLLDGETRHLVDRLA